jgi:D-inositol-3-phosphate glycosyltransferase
VAGRLLLIGHGASPTGFARVIRSLADRLCLRYDTHVFAIETTQASDERQHVWTLHTNPSAPDIHDNASLDHVLRKLDPELVLLVDQPWVAAHRAPVLLHRPGRTVFYAAIEGQDDLTPEIVQSLTGYSVIVTFTHYAACIARKFVPASMPVQVIPHGVDREAFFPFAKVGAGDRTLARQLLFQGGPGSERDAFIVLNANRNQPFKRIDLTLEGFARFAQGKPPNVLLYLHMGTRRSPARPPLVDTLGIRNRLLTTTERETHPNVPDSHLRLIYNACDTGINTSEGEGWGLISFEHAATGAAQLVPRHTACEELWYDSALFLDPVVHDSPKKCQRAGRTVTAEAVSAALESLYRDPEHRQRLSQAAYTNATRPEYDWNNIAWQWDNLFQQLLTQT